jgi:nitrogen fixation NifU-like protein
MSDLRELYQEVILDHSKHPRQCRELEDADHHADGYNPLCGDKITVYLRTQGERIEEVTFQGSGCAISTAAASMMAESLAGRSIDEVRALFERFHQLVTGKIEFDDASGELGKLSIFAGVSQFPVRVKCATLCWHTLRAALDDREAPVSTE